MVSNALASSDRMSLLQLYDGISEFSPEVNRFCGASGDDTAPNDKLVESTKQFLTMRFRSDYSTQHMGEKFALYWDNNELH